MHVYILAPHGRAAGGTKVLLNLAQGLSQRGITVTVIFNKLESLDWFDEPLLFKVKLSTWVTYHDLPGCDVLINFCDGTVYGPYGTVPQILYLQGFGSQDYAREAVNLQYRYAAVVTTSKWLADIVLNCGHSPYIIPPPIDSYFSKQDIAKQSRVTIGTVYHEAPLKNTSLFFDVLNYIQNNIKELSAVFLTARAPTSRVSFKALKCPHTVSINPPRRSIPNVYSQTHVWVSTSLSEGFGLPILEAMACGIPTVVVPSCGLDAHLVNKTNCMLAANTKESVGMAIIALLNNEKLREHIITNGFTLSKKFSMDLFIGSFIEVLNKIK